MIQDAVADERRSGRLRKTLEQTARQRGAKLTKGAIQDAVKFVREYIEHVPLLMEQGSRAAQHLGVETQMGQMLEELENYWFETNDLVPDHLGLLGLADDAYATLFLLQSLSDYCQTTFGKPLLQQNLTAANQGMRGLIGDPVVSVVEQRVGVTCSNAMMRGTLGRLMSADYGFRGAGPDPIWGNASIEDIVNSHLGGIGAIGGKGRHLNEQVDQPEDDNLGLGPDLPQAAPPVAPMPSPETRWLNAEIPDHDKNEPLHVNESYILEFGIDLKALGDAFARIPEASLLFAPGEKLIELIIQLESSHFDVAQNVQRLELPRTGPSLNKARFSIVPRQEGRGMLTAIVHKEGNFVMQMEVAYSIGTIAAEPPSTVAYGRTIAAAAALQPRTLSMVIKPAAGGGYECTVIGTGAKRVILPITETALGDAINAAREGLMSVVSQRDEASRFVFQTGLDIDAASANKALRTLARTGALLFQRVFFGPQAGVEVKQVGELLRTRAMTPTERLNLQIVAERFPIPWGLLYVGEVGKTATLSWDYFLGMRYVIELIPLVNNVVDNSVIQSDRPSLAVSVNVNGGIDKRMRTDVVARQLKFWQEGAAVLGPRLQLAQRQTRADLLDALTGNANDQFMYLYCHAVTAGPGDPGGINGSCLILTDDDRLTLEDLYLEAPMEQPLRGHPLVFINACESAELTPAFYDGFVPYFIAKTARGVIGTECKTPALFATEWALRFFPRFLSGESLGELFLDLRREFCTKHNNPLGLLYAVYCDGDTQIQPGLNI